MSARAARSTSERVGSRKRAVEARSRGVFTWVVKHPSLCTKENSGHSNVEAVPEAMRHTRSVLVVWAIDLWIVGLRGAREQRRMLRVVGPPGVTTMGLIKSAVKALTRIQLREFFLEAWTGQQWRWAPADARIETCAPPQSNRSLIVRTKPASPHGYWMGRVAPVTEHRRP